jgi:serine/threonine-protein kinase RsbT
MESPNYSISFEVKKDDFSAAGEVSTQFKRKLKQIGIDAAVIRRIAVAAYEAEINMIIHSFGGSMTMNIYPESIVLACEDTGPGISDVGLAMQEGYSTASEDIRNMGFGAGMGLPNMNKNADQMAVESSPGGTAIRMTFKI